MATRIIEKMSKNPKIVACTPLRKICIFPSLGRLCIDFLLNFVSILVSGSSFPLVFINFLTISYYPSSFTGAPSWGLTGAPSWGLTGAPSWD